MSQHDAVCPGPAEISEPAFALRSGMLSALVHYLTVHVFKILSPAEGEALIVTALVTHVRRPDSCYAMILLTSFCMQDLPLGCSISARLPVMFLPDELSRAGSCLGFARATSGLHTAGRAAAARSVAGADAGSPAKAAESEQHLHIEADRKADTKREVGHEKG